MKEEQDLDSWEDFVALLPLAGDGKPLFRGQADSSWTLDSTLDRRGRPNMLVIDYYRLIASRVRPQIESITGRTFDVPSYLEVKKALEDTRNSV